MQQIHGQLAGQTVAYVGDYNNVARSLAEACVLLGADVSLGCPVGYAASNEELERLNLLGGGAVRQVHRALEAVRRDRGAHRHVDIDGPGVEKELRKQAFEGFTVTTS